MGRFDDTLNRVVSTRGFVYFINRALLGLGTRGGVMGSQTARGEPSSRSSIHGHSYLNPSTWASLHRPALTGMVKYGHTIHATDRGYAEEEEGRQMLRSG